MKTKLDLILDTVKYGEHEVTIDVRSFSESDKKRIVSRAEKRGLDASSDGKWILIRDLRGV